MNKTNKPRLKVWEVSATSSYCFKWVWIENSTYKLQVSQVSIFSLRIPTGMFFFFTLQILQITLSPCCDKFYVKGLWKSTHRTWRIHRLNSFALSPARLSLIVMTKVKSVTQPPSLWVKKTKTWWNNKKIKQSTFLNLLFLLHKLVKATWELNSQRQSDPQTILFFFPFFSPR